MGVILAAICGLWIFIWGYFFFEDTPSPKRMERFWLAHPGAARSFYSSLSPEARLRTERDARRYWAKKGFGTEEDIRRYWMERGFYENSNSGRAMRLMHDEAQASLEGAGVLDEGATPSPTTKLPFTNNSHEAEQ